MIEYYFAGGALRAVQVFIDASIWIAFGCFIAAIFRSMLGAEKTRALFGNEGRYGLLIGWGIGMLLPVCSLGVIPVVRELYRARVKPGTIVAFGLTAPLFNPLSILYGLTLSDPLAIIIFSAAAMLIVTGLGAVWGKFFSSEFSENVNSDKEANTVATSGTRRSLALIHAASTEMVSWSVVFIAIGVLASAVTSVVFSHGSLQTKVEPDNLFAPAFMACYVTPVYSTPLLAMSQIGRYVSAREFGRCSVLTFDSRRGRQHWIVVLVRICIWVPTSCYFSWAVIVIDAGLGLCNGQAALSQGGPSGRAHTRF